MPRPSAADCGSWAVGQRTLFPPGPEPYGPPVFRQSVVPRFSTFVTQWWCQGSDAKDAMTIREIVRTDRNVFRPVRVGPHRCSPQNLSIRRSGSIRSGGASEQIVGLIGRPAHRWRGRIWRCGRRLFRILGRLTCRQRHAGAGPEEFGVARVRVGQSSAQSNDEHRTAEPVCFGQ